MALLSHISPLNLFVTGDSWLLLKNILSHRLLVHFMGYGSTAERKGFEPLMPFRTYYLSRVAHSTALAPLHGEHNSINLDFWEINHIMYLLIVIILKV